MIKKFAEDIYWLDLPMNGPIYNVNCYLIKGEGRPLLVDTGCNTKECREKMLEYLAELKVEKGELDIFLTHGHADHIGQVAYLAGPETTVYISEEDYLMTQRLTDLQYWVDIERYFICNGWPSESEYAFFTSTYKQPKAFEFGNKVEFVRDGDMLTACGRQFQTLLTPGHTKAHMSLWDKSNNMVFVGDLIVDGVYPTLYYRERGLDMFNMYQQSLETIKGTGASILFSGHKEPIYDTEKSCEKALSNYRKIGDRVFEKLNAQSGDAYTLTQNIYMKNWQLYPLRKKWFCMAGVLSCLESFLLNGLAQRESENGKNVFSLT